LFVLLHVTEAELSSNVQALSMYSDADWGMGTSSFPLILGVDCPAHAKLIDIDIWKVLFAVHT
jgi:hypothetical protein